jgi:hypothetical protein
MSDREDYPYSLQPINLFCVQTVKPDIIGTFNKENK